VHGLSEDEAGRADDSFLRVDCYAVTERFRDPAPQGPKDPEQEAFHESPRRIILL